MASVCSLPDLRSSVFHGKSCTIFIHFFSGTHFYQLAFSYFSFFLEGLAISAVTWKSVVLELLATQLHSLGLKPSDKLLSSGSSLPPVWFV